MGATDDRPDYNYGEHAELRIYALQEGREASTVIYGMDQEKELSVKAVKHGAEIKIHVETEEEYTLRFVNVQVNTSSAAGLQITGKDSLLHLKGTQDLVLECV